MDPGVSQKFTKSKNKLLQAYFHKLIAKLDISGIVTIHNRVQIQVNLPALSASLLCLKANTGVEAALGTLYIITKASFISK